MSKQLLVLACSQTKRQCPGLLPAIDRYDGQAYRIIKRFLRDYQWPSEVSIGILSAKYGLFGSLKGIEYYDTRMNPQLAREKSTQCCATLEKWAKEHSAISLSIGKDYLPAVQPSLNRISKKTTIFEGPIGEKSRQLKSFLESTRASQRPRADLTPGTGRLIYFLPDWDDLLDPSFDFKSDSFSGPTRDERGDKHCCLLMKPKTMCDGILVSLAQHQTSKGPLRRFDGTDSNALAPVSLRSRFGLADDQYLFGDCGAFSYINEDAPTITVDQAVAMYDLYGFDFGASVDHIPFVRIRRDRVSHELSDEERKQRVEITSKNAELFLQATKDRKAQFHPVGTIQALSPEGYAQGVRQYSDMGYRHLAIGGLIPLSDAEIERVVIAVSEAAHELARRPWIHLFGVFRPRLQRRFRELTIDSFDSATYFRKAWLRSDQNYLSTDGTWYAAIRVPMTQDGRTRKKLEQGGLDIAKLEHMERNALRLLVKYQEEQVPINDVLDAICDYDQHLTRSTDYSSKRTQYRRTLEQRPWTSCDCKFCTTLGIHMLVFRGANRNKRRGAHNTLMLYRSVSQS